MRVGFRVTHWGAPVEGAFISSQIPFGLTTGFPMVPTVAMTNRYGEWFGVAPLAASPAEYFVDVEVSDGKTSVPVRGKFDGIENIFHVDIGRGDWTVEKLGERIPGDGFWEPSTHLLREDELIDVYGDPVRNISNCAVCQYFFPVGAPSGDCIINGNAAPPIYIEDARNTTCDYFYPFFLAPGSPKRVIRDLSRIAGQNIRE